MECSHVKTESKGNDSSLDNLHSICTSCNKNISTTNMEDFITIITIHKLPRLKNLDKSHK